MSFAVVREVLFVFASSLYLFFVLRAFLAFATTPRLGGVSPPPLHEWPKLSIVVAACNEVETIEASVDSLLRVDYPNLQIVLVNDRSTDGTGALVDRLVARDPRLSAVHVNALPEGWLGKVHALARGLENATGEWILFADADIIFTQGVVEKAVTLAVRGELDHLTAVPFVETRSFVQTVALSTFGVLLLGGIQKRRVRDPKADFAVGIGAFNLFRRATYDRSEGLEWLRLEVADDSGLALVLKRAGGKSQLWLGLSEISLLWYPSFRATVRGLEKNMFAIAGSYSVTQTLLVCASLSLVGAGPVAFSPVFFHSSTLVAAAFQAALAGAVAVSTLFLGIYTHFAERKFDAQRLFASFFLPVGLCLSAFIVFRSMWVCVRQGAITWRGTRYPLEAMRRGQRIRAT